MRPTRWTRQRRATRYGKGGWRVYRFGLLYIHPVTGDGATAGWNVRRILRERREQERKRRVRRMLGRAA